MNSCCVAFLLLSFAFVASAPSANEDTSCAASKQENRELKVKVGDLERELATARKEADDLRKKSDRRKSDVTKLKTELTTCRTEKSEQEEKEQLCRNQSARAVAKLGQVNRELRVTWQNKTRCEGQKEAIEAELRGALEKGGAACGEADALGERLTNCEETVKAVRERCDRDSADLKRIEKTHDRIRTNLDVCRESLTACEGTRDHLEFLKKGYDVIVQQMEKETKDAKEDKDKSETTAKEAIKGAAKYRLYLAGIAVLAFTGGTVKAYKFAQAKMAERLASLAAEKERLKQEARKKPSSRTDTSKKRR